MDANDLARYSRTIDSEPEVSEEPDMSAIIELARLGQRFHHETQMMHFLLSCGREDDVNFRWVQDERMALSDRISSIMGSMSDFTRGFLKMDRLTPKPEAPKPLTLRKEEL